MSFGNRINATHLSDFAAAVYAGAGMPPADARLVADTPRFNPPRTHPMQVTSQVAQQTEGSLRARRRA